MIGNLLGAVVVAFIGAGLLILVDKYERDTRAAMVLKLWVLVIGSAAILHKLLPLFEIDWLF